MLPTALILTKTNYICCSISPNPVLQKANITFGNNLRLQLSSNKWVAKTISIETDTIVKLIQTFASSKETH